MIGAGTAGWGANWSKSTALASPTIIGHYTHSKANITAVGYWAVDKTCASSPDFSTRQSSAGTFYVDEVSYNDPGPPPPPTDPAYIVWTAMSVAAAETATHRTATLTGTAVDPWERSAQCPDDTSVTGIGYDHESYDTQFYIGARQTFDDDGYVKLYLYTMADATSTGYSAKAEVTTAKIWGSFSCNAD